MTSKQINRAIERTNRRKLIIAGLKARRENKTVATRERKFPRGVLTMAVAEVLRENKRPMEVKEIVEAVEEKVKGGGESVHQLLVSSPRFKNVKRGVYKLTGGKPKSTLFKNLELAGV